MSIRQKLEALVTEKNTPCVTISLNTQNASRQCPGCNSFKKSIKGSRSKNQK